jgi:predicted nucleotidyltransferase component of viral defense system
MIREYLQYKILELIFDTKHASKLSFLGGTCLRIVHGNNRFSEDLDFDNFNLSQQEFDLVTSEVEKGLAKLGFKVEMKNVTKGAYHCYIRFPELLFREGLSGHTNEKISIQLDSEAHSFLYKTEKPIINKFDVFTQISSTPADILLSMKFFAVINRKKNKGRDFFDIVSLLGNGFKPNYRYLEHKLGINSAKQLKVEALKKCTSLNMKEMALDVKPFLFNPSDDKKVLLFEKYLEQVDL